MSVHVENLEKNMAKLTLEVAAEKVEAVSYTHLLRHHWHWNHRKQMEVIRCRMS